MSIPNAQRRLNLKQQRLRVLAWLLRQGRPIRQIDIARALGIDSGHIQPIVDHWWFQRTRADGTWLSEWGARELTGNHPRAYDAAEARMTL